MANHTIPKRRKCERCGNTFIKRSRGMKLCSECTREARHIKNNKRNPWDINSERLERLQRIFNTNHDFRPKRHILIEKILEILKHNPDKGYTVNELHSIINEDRTSIRTTVSYIGHNRKYDRIRLKKKRNQTMVIWYDSQSC